MSESKKLVMVITHGLDNERASVAWSITNGGVKSGLDVSVFLVANGVDWVRKGAADVAQLNPLDPTMGEMIMSFMATGNRVMVCPPCAKVRGYSEDDLLPGIEIVGSTALHELIKEGAAVISI